MANSYCNIPRLEVKSGLRSFEAKISARATMWPKIFLLVQRSSLEKSMQRSGMADIPMNAREAEVRSTLGSTAAGWRSVRV